MPSIRCTKKLQKEAGLNELPQTPSHPNDWHANLVWVERKKIVLFCSSDTLYCCATPPSGRAQIRKMQELFISALQSTMLANGFSDITIRHALNMHSEMQFAPTDNRSVVGSMNDYVFQLDHRIWYEGGIVNHDPAGMSAKLNEIPQVPRDFFNAKEAFQRKLIHSVA